MITQKWQGWVESIDKFAGEFVATIRDITNPDYPDESVALRISDVRPEHLQDVLEEGMVFDWTIEVDDQGNGKSTILFRDEKFTAEDIARIYERARLMAEALGLPIPQPPNGP